MDLFDIVSISPRPEHVVQSDLERCGIPLGGQIRLDRLADQMRSRGALLSGALVGAAVYKSREGSSAAGAVVGGLGAVAATFISYALRVGISKQANWPVAAVGVGEDALVLGSGAALLRAQPGRRGR